MPVLRHAEDVTNNYLHTGNYLIDYNYQAKIYRMQYFLELTGLFSAAFLSATFLPLQSELVFAATLMADHHPDWLLLLIASFGNILGSALNWWLGCGIAHFENKRWFQHYGKWSLLLSWVPVIGDPITMIAGVLRMRFLTFIMIVAIAKTGRYLVIMLFLN